MTLIFFLICMTTTALRWTAEGHRSHGRPKETWHRSIEMEMRQHGLNWDTARHQAEDRRQWRSLVPRWLQETLCKYMYDN